MPMFEPGELDTDPETYWGHTPVGYETVHAGDICRITAYMKSGYRIEWELDPGRDYLCTRSAGITPDDVVDRAADIEYKQYGKVWFPTRIEFEFHGKPIFTATVMHAEFDEPHHAQRLGPETLEMLPLTEIENLVTGEQLHWDGRRALPYASIKSRIGVDIDDKAYWSRIQDIQQGRAGAEPRVVLPEDVGRSPGLWEQYVRAFIARYELNEEQCGRAWSTLGECRRKAHAHLERSADEFTKIDDELRSFVDEAAKSVDASSRERAKEVVAQLEARRAKLLEPVGEVFEHDLKPDLETLPTREQREKAERKPSGDR